MSKLLVCRIPRRLAAALLVFGAPAIGANPFRAAVLTGLDAVPGIPGAVFSNTISGTPRIDGSGLVAFATGTTSPISTGIWSEANAGANGALTLIAVQGGPVPGVPGAVFPAISGVRFVLSDNGRVAFPSAVIGAGNPNGIWSQEGPSLALVALQGQIAPVAPPGLWNPASDTPLALSRNGRTAFTTQFAVGNGNYNALFYGVPSGTLMCARSELDLAKPGFVSFGTPDFNDNFNFGVIASYRNQDGVRTGIYTGNCASLSVVVSHGATIPSYIGLPEFETFISPFLMNMSGANEFAFTSGLNGSDVNSGNDTALWLKTNSGFRMIAREGAAAEAIGPGVFYRDFISTFAGPYISQSGHVLFRIGLGGPGVAPDSGFAILRYNPDGTISKICRLADPVPGFPAGATYGGFGNGGMALNDWGQVCFAANVSNPGPGRNPFPMMASDLTGEVRVLFEPNTIFPVRPGIQARITSATEPLPSGGSDGRPRNWNASAQFAFRGGYTITSGPGTGNSGVGLFVVGFPECPGDLNHDGYVDDADFSIFAPAYNILLCSDPAMPEGCPADLNHDDAVDDADFGVFVVTYNALLCP